MPVVIALFLRTNEALLAGIETLFRFLKSYSEIMNVFSLINCINTIGIEWNYILFIGDSIWQPKQLKLETFIRVWN